MMNLKVCGLHLGYSMRKFLFFLKSQSTYRQVGNVEVLKYLTRWKQEMNLNLTKRHPHPGHILVTVTGHPQVIPEKVYPIIDLYWRKSMTFIC
jgi:hypothetical protein